MAGTSTAQGQGCLQGRLELQVEKDRLSARVVRSSRTSSPKTPSLCPLRCTNASHQYQAGGWNSLELPFHGDCCAAGTYLPAPTKTPSEALRCAMGPSTCPHVAVPCLGAALGHWAAAGRAPVGYQDTASSRAVPTGQLRKDEEVPSGTHRY